MRERAVMIDAGFEAVLGTVVLLGVVFGSIDERDYPGPASDLLLGVFGLGLFAFAWLLGEIVKRGRVTDIVLGALAAGNAAFALLLAAWALIADGFHTASLAVVWFTVAMLLLLAVTQALLRGTEP
jgi:hypothetical protein